MVLRYAEVEAILAELSEHIARHGPLAPTGDVSRVVTEYRHLVRELRTLAGALGIVVTKVDDSPPDPLSALGADG